MQVKEAWRCGCQGPWLDGVYIPSYEKLFVIFFYFKALIAFYFSKVYEKGNTISLTVLTVISLKITPCFSSSYLRSS